MRKTRTRDRRELVCPLCGCKVGRGLLKEHAMTCNMIEVSKNHSSLIRDTGPVLGVSKKKPNLDEVDS